MCISGSCGFRGSLGFLGSRGSRGSLGFLGSSGSLGSCGSVLFISFPVQAEVESEMVQAHIYLRQGYFSLVRDRLRVERVDKFVVLSQEMKCFTKFVYLLVAFNILGCSYAYNMPISEASVNN